MKDIVLIGSGKWGMNYIKTLASFDVSIKVANRSNWKDLIDSMPDGVIIATPPDSHIEIASYALSRNIPTMIEKPLALSLEQVEQLKQYAAPILVDYIHLFTEGYENLYQVVDASKITFIKTNGYGNSPQRNYSSLWDYGPHDLAMILYLSKSFPKAAIASKRKTSSGELYTIVLKFDGFNSITTIGNGGDTKTRNIEVLFNGLEINYDDLERPIEHKSPLQKAVDLFINEKFEDDRFGLDLSLKITKLLECCEESIKIGTMIYTS